MNSARADTAFFGMQNAFVKFGETLNAVQVSQTCTADA
jgi:hypothetical protein